MQVRLHLCPPPFLAVPPDRVNRIPGDQYIQFLKGTTLQTWEEPPLLFHFAVAAVTSEDRAYMRRALDLARTALGKTYPNPVVGCVIVKDGELVGEGYHPRAGLPHAEVYALRAAGQAAAGATAYVTLEPCDHYGRTPPCSRALVAAGIARVVVGVGDPNPLVDGGGVATLKSAGIEVDVGCEEDACYIINEEFMSRMKRNHESGGE